MDKNIAIQARNISKTFKVPHERHSSLKAHAVNIFSRNKYSSLVTLDDITISINKGEFFGIVGKNGSGKSTLLKILAGIYQPTEGEIEVSGSLAPFIELGVGFNPELTGRENVFLSGVILGLSRKKIEKIYTEIVEFAELEEFMDQKLKNYSSGMQVRLAFSIAVRAESDILLIDEVLAVGDEAFQAKCFEYFNKIKSSDKTIVFVSHDMDSVKRFCDKAVYIKDGKIATQGNTSKVADHYSMDNYESLKSKIHKKVSNNNSSKDIYIKDLSIVRDNITKDQEIVIEFQVESKLKKDIIAAISFTREDGVYVAGFNSSEDLSSNVLKKGNNTFSCKVLPNQLTKGRYILDAVISDAINLGMIDSYSNGQPLNIVESIKTNDGTFNIKGKWEKNA